MILNFGPIHWGGVNTFVSRFAWFLTIQESEASEPALKHLHAVGDDDSDDDDVNVHSCLFYAVLLSKFTNYYGMLVELPPGH